MIIVRWTYEDYAKRRLEPWIRGILFGFIIGFKVHQGCNRWFQPEDGVRSSVIRIGGGFNLYGKEGPPQKERSEPRGLKRKKAPELEIKDYFDMNSTKMIQITVKNGPVYQEEVSVPTEDDIELAKVWPDTPKYLKEAFPDAKRSGVFTTATSFVKSAPGQWNVVGAARDGTEGENA